MSRASADATRDFITALRWLADHPGELAWRRRACEAMRIAADAIEANGDGLSRIGPEYVVATVEKPRLNIDGVELIPGFTGIGRAEAIDASGCLFRGEVMSKDGVRCSIHLKLDGTRLDWEIPAPGGVIRGCVKEST